MVQGFYSYVEMMCFCQVKGRVDDLLMLRLWETTVVIPALDVWDDPAAQTSKPARLNTYLAATEATPNNQISVHLY